MKKLFLAAALFSASLAVIVLALAPKMAVTSQIPQQKNLSLAPAASIQSTPAIPADASLPTLPIPPQKAETAPAVSVPILVYHHIGSPPRNMPRASQSFFIEPEWLEKHLQYLEKNNYTAIRFSDVAAYFENGTPLPLKWRKKPVIITFDDGYKSTFEAARPLLQKYNMTATVFIPTNLVGLGRGAGSRMTWEDIAQLRDEGWEIGSHSLWHPYLTKSLKARDEIFESKRKLEEQLGAPIEVFAYPFGDFNDATEALVKEAGYKLARSYSERYEITRENLFRLPVVKVWGNLELGVFLRALANPAGAG